MYLKAAEGSESLKVILTKTLKKKCEVSKISSADNFYLF